MIEVSDECFVVPVGHGAIVPASGLQDEVFRKSSKRKWRICTHSLRCQGGRPFEGWSLPLRSGKVLAGSEGLEGTKVDNMSPPLVTVTSSL